jgi:F-box/leucine-rich repeat protein 2/20|uniref:F-box domain-containing protein n=1 Tax=Fagus sylvatica TaxID=28930 RepID=A0A2N9IHY7_FAGSY
MEGLSRDGITSIINLPDDCLFLIFQRLDCSCDRESFGLTCHRWLHIQNLSRRFLQFECSFTQLNLSSLSQTSLIINSFHLHRLFTRFQHLQSLSLSGCTELLDLDLTQLQYCGSNLQTLFLDCCQKITDHGLFLAATCCPSLTVIRLYRCNITDVGLEILANACSALKDVNLSYCANISDNGLKAITQGCRQLLVVRMSSCGNVSGTGFKGCSSTLAHVEAESCKLKPEGIMGMVSGGGLEYLNISVPNCWTYGGSLAAIGTGFATSLKILNLRMCRTIGDESIIAIAKGCPLLQEWSLALCHEVRITGWESIGFNCLNLKKLHVNRCRNLCDGGLLALRDGCKQLSVLYMSGCRRITSTAIELFKCYRSNVDIKEEEIMCIGPDWGFR